MAEQLKGGGRGRTPSQDKKKKVSRTIHGSRHVAQSAKGEQKVVEKRHTRQSKAARGWVMSMRLMQQPLEEVSKPRRLISGTRGMGKAGVKVRRHRLQENSRGLTQGKEVHRSDSTKNEERRLHRLSRGRKANTQTTLVERPNEKGTTGLHGGSSSVSEKGGECAQRKNLK